MNDLDDSWEIDFSDNSSLCFSYIPDIDEYHSALGSLWVTFVVIGSLTCILLYCLFLETILFAVQRSHAVFRNSLLWISSIYPLMTLMTVVGFVIPRAQSVCYTVKLLYLMIGISKFMELTLLMYGSEEVMLWTVQNSTLNLRQGPICCCLCCLPNMGISKKKLRLIIAGIQQLPFTQMFFLVMIMILQAANEVVVGSLDPAGSYFWLNWFSFFTSLLGVYCLNLVSKLSKGHLQRYSYSKLSFVMEALILVTQMQSLIFNILAHYEAFPCIPPISHYVYKETVENSFYLFEMLVFGIYSYKNYRSVSFETSNPVTVRLDSKGNIRPHYPAFVTTLASHDVTPNYGTSYPGTDFMDDRDQFPSQEIVTGSPLGSGLTDALDFSRSTLVVLNDEHNLNSDSII